MAIRRTFGIRVDPDFMAMFERYVEVAYRGLPTVPTRGAVLFDLCNESLLARVKTLPALDREYIETGKSKSKRSSPG